MPFKRRTRKMMRKTTHPKRERAAKAKAAVVVAAAAAAARERAAKAKAAESASQRTYVSCRVLDLRVKFKSEAILKPSHNWNPRKSLGGSAPIGSHKSSFGC